MPSPRTTFLSAAAAVADLVDTIPSTAWDGPGLGVWDLRALVGHTSRALVTVVTYLGQPAAAEEIATPEAYYARSPEPAAPTRRPSPNAAGPPVPRWVPTPPRASGR